MDAIIYNDKLHSKTTFVTVNRYISTLYLISLIHSKTTFVTVNLAINSLSCKDICIQKQLLLLLIPRF